MHIVGKDRKLWGCYLNRLTSSPKIPMSELLRVIWENLIEGKKPYSFASILENLNVVPV